jgi:Family of unknown function (DUF6042)
MVLWFLHSETGSPPAGDLDNADAPWVDIVAPDGLDQPYDPTTEEGDQAEIDEQVKRWGEWQGYAKVRGLPMTTYRHVIEFMVELRLIERREDGMDISWTIVSPLPNVDEILPLPPERREYESLMRWRARFSAVSEAICSWIGQLKLPDAESLEIATSIQALAEELSLDPEDARHGLAVLLDDDIRCDPNPETAAIDTPLQIAVDWKLFEDFRTPYRAVPRDEDLGH